MTAPVVRAAVAASDPDGAAVVYRCAGGRHRAGLLAVDGGEGLVLLNARWVEDLDDDAAREVAELLMAAADAED